MRVEDVELHHVGRPRLRTGELVGSQPGFLVVYAFEGASRGVDRGFGVQHAGDVR